MIPSSFFLKDVQYTDRKAARRGSINDVFAGTFQGTKVALKRLRTGDQQRNDELKQLYQILDGLTYLHSEGVVHGNLHGGNVLVDEIGNACLTDFGQASLVEMVNNLQAVESSRAEHLRWTAPELIKVSGNATVAPGRRTGTREGDVFSFACICVELYSGKPPMSELTGVQAGRRYVGVISCWVQRPSVRPSAEAARNQMGVIGNILGRMLDETQLQLNDAKAELNDTKVELNAAKHEWATKEKIYTGQIVDLESKVAALSKSLEAEIISHPNLPLQKRHTDLTREFEMYRLSMRGLGEQVQKSMQEQTAQNAQRWDALRVSMQEQAVQDVQRWDALRLNFQAQLNSFQKDDVGKTKEQHSASS
ncbi:hypothetical protein EUX98_g6209 [Antrodiella citrinella]|uniref:Protein kinase domain-containing protein n=1 Tax=Antrodiella citrinella TaxID=2447956 RepID=A0A4S4MRQ5_9APHY|nr:hypothetical protein EUX98_g6209 [Antrodiella citrinella]